MSSRPNLAAATAHVDCGAVVVTGCKVVYVIRPDELIGLLLRDPALWCKAVRRGKAYRRGLATERRMSRPPVTTTEGNLMRDRGEGEPHEP